MALSPFSVPFNKFFHLSTIIAQSFPLSPSAMLSSACFAHIPNILDCRAFLLGAPFVPPFWKHCRCYKCGLYFTHVCVLAKLVINSLLSRLPTPQISDGFGLSPTLYHPCFGLVWSCLLGHSSNAFDSRFSYFLLLNLMITCFFIHSPVNHQHRQPVDHA